MGGIELYSGGVELYSWVVLSCTHGRYWAVLMGGVEL